MKKNLFANIVEEFKADREANKSIVAEKKEAAKKKAEEGAYNLLTGVYGPAYVAGYAYESGKAVIDKVAATKAGQAVKKAAEDVKFSAKTGFNDGREAKVDMDAERLYRKATAAMAEREDTIMCGGPCDEEDWSDFAD
jgi:hypothetical protein